MVIPWIVISIRTLPGRAISIENGISMLLDMLILPVIRTDWTALILSLPPRAARFFSISSSTVWAEAAAATRLESRRVDRSLRIDICPPKM